MNKILDSFHPSDDISVFIIIAMVIIAYLLGSISPSIILAKRKGVDIKKEGSGNAGTTNTLRVLGKKAAIITLCIDIIKGIAAIMLAKFIADDFTAMLCVFAVFAGHVWPIFFKFKGGKGVATLFGAVLAFSPVLALIDLGIVVLIMLITGMMSAGSIVGGLTLPLVAYFICPGFCIPACIIALLLIWTHRENIKRIFKGEESKVFRKSK